MCVTVYKKWKFPSPGAFWTQEDLTATTENHRAMGGGGINFHSIPSHDPWFYMEFLVKLIFHKLNDKNCPKVTHCCLHTCK